MAVTSYVITVCAFGVLFPLILIVTATSTVALRFAWRTLVVFGFISFGVAMALQDYIRAAIIPGAWILWCVLIRFTVIQWRMYRMIPVENKERIRKLLERAQTATRSNG